MRFVPRPALQLGIALLSVTVMGRGGAAQAADRSALLREFTWRAIGPSNLGGRVDDVEAVPSDPRVVYMGGANSGVWKSENSGTTWTPVFDGQPNLSIGDIAIAPSNPNVVWVGTGEPNARQSTTYGAGVFKSTDAGKTWAFMGLGKSGHVGRILIDPRNPDVVYVAALGDLFKADDERGLFKTSDGGKTWVKSKYIDENTGFTDLVMDPSNSSTLIAASYQRRRTAWGYNGGGPGSGLWKTTDAGRSWTRIEGGGLPAYGNWGRVGLDFSRSNPNIVYAVIEPGPSQGFGRGGGGGGAGGGRGAGRGGGRGAAGTPAPLDPKSPGVWRSEDKGKSWQLVSNENGRPIYFSQVRVDPKDPNTIYVLERSFAKSTDGGRTFNVASEAALAGIQNANAPSIEPFPDPEPGRSFPPSHPDYHAMWIDPNDSKHIWIGHDGGVDVSYDGARTWMYVNWMPIGQFYEVAADMRYPYVVYGGAQDSGIWGIPSRVRNGAGITKEHVFALAFGDGYHVMTDPSDWATVYAEVSGNGGQHTWRYNLRTGEQKYIRPTPPNRGGRGQGVALGAEGNIITPLPANEVLRFNWNPGLAMSPHNSRVIYFGTNRLFTSYDRGDSWVSSPDLTKNIDRNTLPIMGVPGTEPMPSKHDGVAQWGTIVAIAESPVVPGVLWVGTDDGNLQVSRDGGATWENVADNAEKLPNQYYFVDAIEPSHSDGGTAYAAFDGHRSGDYRPHLYKTTDYGKTWVSLTNGLPAFGHVNVVREDPINHKLLFAGTETGFYISLDGGRQWTPFMRNLPATISDDVLIHRRERDLVLATHGRSFFIMDDISALEQLSDAQLARDEFLVPPRVTILWDHDRQTFRGGGEDMWRAQNPPDAIFSYYLKSPAQGAVKLQVVDVTGAVVLELDGAREAGIHRVSWDLRLPPPSGANDAALALGDRIAPGTYALRLVANGRTATAPLTIIPDPNRTAKN